MNEDIQPTKHVSEPLDAALERLNKMAQQPTPPERLAEMEQERRDRAAREIGSLRIFWNAPKRHVSNSTIRKEGEWGRRLTGLTQRLGSGLLVALIGKRGPGKTQMAVELMRISTSRLRSAYYMTAIEFFTKIKATYRQDGRKEEGELLRELRKFKLLVIDEVGKRAETDWENNLLFELVNCRYNDMTDTLLIDNSEPGEFEQAIGPSMVSRINEAGGIVHCNWPSFRV